MNKISNALYHDSWQEDMFCQFNVFLLVLAVVIMCLNLFFIRSSFLSAVVWLLLICNLFRTYSRNIYKRREENEKIFKNDSTDQEKI